MWTSGQLDSVPSPTEGLGAPGLATSPYIYKTGKERVIAIAINMTNKRSDLHMGSNYHNNVEFYKSCGQTINQSMNNQ